MRCMRATAPRSLSTSFMISPSSFTVLTYSLAASDADLSARSINVGSVTGTASSRVLATGSAAGTGTLAITTGAGEGVGDEACAAVCDLSSEGAGIEVSYFDNDDEDGQDTFGLIFVGPSPEAIHETQRQYMQEDLTRLLERHFDKGEMSEVVDAVNRLFARRLVSITQGQKLARVDFPTGGHGGSKGGGKRHLH